MTVTVSAVCSVSSVSSCSRRTVSSHKQEATEPRADNGDHFRFLLCLLCYLLLNCQAFFEQEATEGTEGRQR